MSNAPDGLLEDVELQDVEDAVALIEKSFNIWFQQEDLLTVKTFGDLCDLVHHKIRLEHQDDCTSQQAYYKLSRALSFTFKTEEPVLNPNVLIEDLIPRKGRIKKVKMLEKALDLKLFILSPRPWLVITLAVIFILSLLAFFFNSLIALSGIVFSIFGIWIATKFGEEINVKTVGQLTDQMVTYNYLKSRRNPNTVNRNEVNDVVVRIFVAEFFLEPAALHKDAKFGNH